LISNSFSGDVINPIIDARLQISLSAVGLAKKLGLSRQYIQRAEAGTYTSLNPALLKWVANRLSISVGDVVKRYVQFQKATRFATVEKFDPHTLARQGNNTDAGHVIFEHWRSGYWNSSLAFANAFCLHPETVRTYEEGDRKEMPLAIRTALNETGLLNGNWIERPEKGEALSGSVRA
jgi:transcriptional regulator with XRE-family HTH domain